MKKKTGANPWEDREEIGLPQALWGTLKIILLKPKDFWDSLKIEDSFTGPYLFFLGVAIPAFFVNSLIRGFMGKSGEALFFWVSLFGVIVSVVIMAL